jgi:hypothetical protein
MITVTAERLPKLRAELHDLLPEVRRGVYATGGKALEVYLRKFYRKKNAEPNKQRWPKSNFFNRQGAQKTALNTVKDGAFTVTVASEAIAFKYQGGVITPKRGKYLSIPKTPEAKVAGAPGEGGMKDLIFIAKSGKDYAFLATKDSVGRLTFQYLLVKQTFHRPDKSVLPTDRQMTSTVIKAMSRAIERKLRQ